MKFSKRDLNLIKFAIKESAESLKSVIDAYSCPYCHGTKIFQDRTCSCKTGYMKNSSTLVRQFKGKIQALKQLKQKINENDPS